MNGPFEWTISSLSEVYNDFEFTGIVSSYYPALSGAFYFNFKNFNKKP